MPLLALVHVHNLLRVDGQVLVGVDDHAEEAGVRLQEEESWLVGTGLWWSSEARPDSAGC